MLNGPCQAWISTQHTMDGLTFTGHCRSLLQQPNTYRYELRLRKWGNAGQSSSSQGGQFELVANQQLVLSQIRVNSDSQTHYQVHLRIFNAANELVAQDSVQQSGTNSH